MQPLPCGRKRPSTQSHSSYASAPKNQKGQPKTAAISPDWKTTLNQYLKDQGLRATSQREKVAEIALSRKTHFEIQSLIRDVQQKYPEISPATVYRSVKTLCDADILHETLQSHTGVTLYEAHDDEHHDHIVCMDCGEIFEFHDEGMEAAQLNAINKLGFDEAKHKHVIYAKCSFLKK